MKSFAGLAGYLADVHIDWGFAVLVTTAAVVGSLAGGLLAGRIPQDALRKSFGWFVAVMGVFVLSQQTSSDLRHTLLTSPWTWASVAVAAGIAFGWYMPGRHGRTPERADTRSARLMSRVRPGPPHESGVTHVSGEQSGPGRRCRVYPVGYVSQWRRHPQGPSSTGGGAWE
jgi:hypothetical protein